MAYPSFSAGEVLTATDMNAVGLWKITTGSLSSTATNFQSCFSSSYRNYLILIDSPSLSNTADIYVRFMSGSTPITGADYFWAFTGLSQDGTASTSAAINQTLGYTGFSQQSANGLVIGGIQLTVYGPNLAQRTFVKCATFSYAGSQSNTRDGGIRHNLTTAYDGIQFLTASAVTMSGTVTIYGYK